MKQHHTLPPAWAGSLAMDTDGAGHPVSALFKPTDAVPTALPSVARADLLALLLSHLEQYQQRQAAGLPVCNAELTALVPSLVDAGIFTLFTPAEWIAGDNSPRRIIGLAAQEYLAGPHK